MHAHCSAHSSFPTHTIRFNVVILCSHLPVLSWSHRVCHVHTWSGGGSAEAGCLPPRSSVWCSVCRSTPLLGQHLLHLLLVAARAQNTAQAAPQPTTVMTSRVTSTATAASPEVHPTCFCSLSLGVVPCATLPGQPGGIVLLM